MDKKRGDRAPNDSAEADRHTDLPNLQDRDEGDYEPGMQPPRRREEKAHEGADDATEEEE